MPTAGVQKTLHQRNKSSPSLSTMLNAGGLKTAAKRTAFGDVSNTANVSRPSKDDSVIGGKGDYMFSEKAIPAPQEKKTTALLRPAQRPLSVSGLKNLLNNVPNYSSQTFVKQPLVEVQETVPVQNQAENVRKVVAKKSTAIFKDAAPAQSKQSALDLQNLLAPAAPVAPVHRDLPALQHVKRDVQCHEPQPRLTRKQSKYMTQQELLEIPAPAKTTETSSEEPAASRSDGVYIDEEGQAQAYDYVDPVRLAEAVSIAKASMGDAEIPVQDSRTSLEQILDTRLVKPQPEPVRKSTLAPVSEPEEYWDDEGEENYDEEGYVTARSFKSRGENTTGGATTVLFPKVSQKAKRELAVAKEVIEGSKTAEEIEDEAWDTTMVAEYGEEIFQYMKDLEV